MVAEVRAAMEAAEVEFAVTDCGTRSSRSSVSDADVGRVVSDMLGETILLGEQGATGEVTGGSDEQEGDCVAMEFVARADGGFSPVAATSEGPTDDTGLRKDRQTLQAG